jgi:hypothetical protein
MTPGAQEGISLPRRGTAERAPEGPFADQKGPEFKRAPRRAEAFPRRVQKQ